MQFMAVLVKGFCRGSDLIDSNYEVNMSQAQIIDGKAFAAGLTDRIGEAVTAFMNDGNPQPGLAVVLVGEDPASQVYVRNKIRTTLACGMRSIEHKLDVDTSQDDLVALIEQLNNDDGIDGILVQLPLPNISMPMPSSTPLIRKRMSMASTSLMSAGFLLVRISYPLHALWLPDAVAGTFRRPFRQVCRCSRPVQHCRQTDGTAAAGG